MQKIKVAVIDDCLAARETFSFLLSKTATNLDITEIEYLNSVTDILEYDVVFLDEVMRDLTGTDIIAHVLDHVDYDYDSLPCLFFITGFTKKLLFCNLETRKIDVDKLKFEVLEKPVSIPEMGEKLLKVCPKIFKDAKCLSEPTIAKAIKSAFSAVTGVSCG